MQFLRKLLVLVCIILGVFFVSKLFIRKEYGLVVQRDTLNQALALRYPARTADEPWTILLKQPQVMKSKPRILILGDSFVDGHGYINVNDVWWQRLDRELKSRGFDVEIIAYGYGGWSTYQELAAARNIVKKYRPDIVIWGYVDNDPDEHVCVYPFALSERLQSRHGEVLFIAGQFIERSKMKALDHVDWCLYLLQNKANYIKFKTTLTHVGAFIQDQNIPQFFVGFPTDYALSTKTYKIIKPLFAENHIPFYDIRAQLEAYDRAIKADGRTADLSAFPMDGHPGPALTQKYALLVADILEKKYSAILGYKHSFPGIKFFFINDIYPTNVAVQQSAGGNSLKLHLTMDSKNPQMITYPLSGKYISLHLQDACNLKQIMVSGTGVHSLRCAITQRDPVYGYDPRKVVFLKNKYGRNRFWTDTENDLKQVSTLLIEPTFALFQQRIELEIWIQADKNQAIAADFKVYPTPAEKTTLMHVSHESVYHPYRYGTQLQFSRQGNVHKYLGEGWSIPESGRGFHTWTEGANATLILRVKPATKDLRLCLNALPSVVTSNFTSQRVEFFINEVFLGAQRIDSKNPGPYKIKVPKGVVATQNITLRMHFPEALYPAQVGLLGDTMLRSLKVASLVLQEVESNGN